MERISDELIALFVCLQYYTHFTSPIRRYADVIVHRQLTAALEVDANGGYEEFSEYLEEGGEETYEGDDKQLVAKVPVAKKVVSNIAEHCTERKYAAKKAQDTSGEKFLAMYLRDHPMEADCVVIGIGKSSFTLLVLE